MGKGVDLLLVTPPSRAQVYQGLGNELAAIETPVWSGLIATFMRNRGYSVQMLDAEALNLTHDETAQEIVRTQAALSVFVVYGQQPSGSTQCMPGGRVVAQKVNELAPWMHTIVMGTHASALPKRTLLEEPYEFVCQGEGPYTILGLLETIKAGSMRLDTVPGLWFRQKDQPIGNPAAKNITDLDKELPYQAWDLLDMSKYRAHNWHCFDHIDERAPYVSIQTSLGCPYKCTFCCIHAPFGGSGIRYWSPENTVQQIDVAVNKYGVKNIKFPDEMFVLNERHVIEICDLIIGRGYKINIWAYARVDTMREKFLEKLKKAGINWIALGIESGSKHVRDGVEKGRFGDHQIEATVKKTRDAGIYVLGNYIFGLPDDTHESMRDTLDLAKHLNTHWANFYSAMAYPGSPLHNMALEKGWRLPDDWGGYSQHAYETLPLPTETLSGPQVLAFRDKAFMEYYTNPHYLESIRIRFGKRVVDHIKGMVGQPLKRKYVWHTAPSDELSAASL